MSFKENTAYSAPSIRLKELLATIYNICPRLKNIIRGASDYHMAFEQIKRMINLEIQNNPRVQNFLDDSENQQKFKQLQYADYALVRLYDYIKYSDSKISTNGDDSSKIQTQVFYLLWMLDREKKAIVHADFLEDLKALFIQYKSSDKKLNPQIDQLKAWMLRHSTGLDTKVIELRAKNKERIIRILIREISNTKQADSKYYLEPNLSFEDKYRKLEFWWNDYHFHLHFAIRKPELLNEMLDYSLSSKEVHLFEKAYAKGIPLFINPYYLSLILVRPPKELEFTDKTLRDYIFYSEELVNEFGRIKAWEKEDQVEAGKPNAAGWILPNSHNIHRRYPEVAIFIPDSMGRACGGLCVSCQRMYDFQRGNLNFKLDKLRPKESWTEKLRSLMDYFEFDSQLKDILITGGDSLMSSTTSLKNILEAVYDMALRKKDANKNRLDGKKFAEIQRIRLGTRLPVYLPQRIDDNLVKMLSDFRIKAQKIGISEFVIQVHFESPMEISPEATSALKKLNISGWVLVNQQVFTAAASRRGYAAKLRQMLNQLGVIPYYTFTVKGFRENQKNFVPNARSVQEIMEEKVFGKISKDLSIKAAFFAAVNREEYLSSLLQKQQLPFLATDRNVFNLPALGKSLSFRVIGVTADGRRILMFKHDQSRRHSPAVQETDQIFVVESKSIAAYLRQLEEMGENKDDYQGIYGYSLSLTEARSKIFEYPNTQGNITSSYTNFEP